MVSLCCLSPVDLRFSVPLKSVTLNLTRLFPEGALYSGYAWAHSNIMESWWFQRTSQRLNVGVENGSNNFMLAFTCLNGSLCTHAISFCTILMTEWICWYEPFWIQRGESYHKGYLEEWERWTSRKTMPLEKTSCARPQQPERLKEYRRPGR